MLSVEVRSEKLSFFKIHFIDEFSTNFMQIKREKVQVSILLPEFFKEIIERSAGIFPMTSFSDEAIKRFQEGILSDLGAAVTQAVDARLPELKNVG